MTKVLAESVDGVSMNRYVNPWGVKYLSNWE